MTARLAPWPLTPRARAGALVLLFLTELAALALAYQVLTRFECSQTDMAGLCRGLQSAVARAIVVIGAGALMLWARPAALAGLLAPPAGRRAIWLHLAGVALLFLPLALAPGGNLAAVFGPALVPWALGAVLAGIGGLLWLAPWSAWRRLATQAGPGGLTALAGAALLPDLVRLLAPLWDIRGLTTLTFHASAAILSLFEPSLTVDPATARIGAGPFVVQVASQCSGIEGAALVTAFGLLYAALFRADLRLGRFLLVVLPLALLASWLLNALRIALLILIGARVSPDLALNGFHSHAGWLFFSAVALGMVGVAEALPWLHRAPRPRRAGSLRADQGAALVLPFAVFMLASLLTHALTEVPETAYPLRVLALGPGGLAVLAGLARLGLASRAVAAGRGAGGGRPSGSRSPRRATLAPAAWAPHWPRCRPVRWRSGSGSGWSAPSCWYHWSRRRSFGAMCWRACRHGAGQGRGPGC